MDINTSCGNLEDIDFNDPTHLWDILYEDKHTRVEGLCSEVAFMEDVVQGNLDPVTADFWFSLEEPLDAASQYHVRKIMTNPLVRLTELDYQVLDKFAALQPVIPVSVVYFDEPSRTFRHFVHHKDARYDSVDGLGTVMSPRANRQHTTERNKDKTRIAKACAYLEERGLLKDIAIKRLFANCWLGDAVWDVDVFTRSSTGRLVAFEVKHKYPSYSNTYGLNDGQKILFDFFRECEIPVVHVILRKPERNKHLHGIDLLTKPIYTKRTDWIFTHLKPENMTHSDSSAPKHTSMSGQSDMGFYNVHADHFVFLKKLGGSAEGVKEKLLTGIE
jgi:hypothetical protein